MPDYLKEAQEFKTDEKYTESLAVLGRGISENPYEYSLYYAMGKLYYLMKDANAAVKYYLISLHLHILDIENSEQKKAVDILLMDIPEEARKVLKKFNDRAACVLTDINTPRHIAHSFIDLGRHRIVDEQYISQYEKSISGLEDINDTDEKESNFYYMLGLDYCLNIMNFELEREHVFNYYLNLKEDMMEQLFKDVYEQFLNHFNEEENDN